MKKKTRKNKSSCLLLVVLLCIGTIIFAQPNRFGHNYEFPDIFYFDSFFETSQEISIVAVGDLMMGSWIVDIVGEQTVDYPFSGTAGLVKNADIAVANLEAPFTSSADRYEGKTFTFKVPGYMAPAVKRAGFDVLNLANNHILDYGESGLNETTGILDSLGLHYSGAGQSRTEACSPALVRVKNRKIAFFGYSMTYPSAFWATDENCGTCYPILERMQADIRSAKQIADWVVVSFHWGQEKNPVPRDYQILYAHKAIDNGADLVLGHHPHVMQGLEWYKNKLIAYSLGNYVFGSFSKTATQSFILKVVFSKTASLSAVVYPIDVDNKRVRFQPRLLSGNQREEVVDSLNALSRKMNMGHDIIDKRGVSTGLINTLMVKKR
ncbi:MAG: CapA family protein [candidate division KSB1 bacterium]|nr:CapA family protein [candidate division KSB1 bacterium]